MSAWKSIDNHSRIAKRVSNPRCRGGPTSLVELLFVVVRSDPPPRCPDPGGAPDSGEAFILLLLPPSGFEPPRLVVLTREGGARSGGPHIPAKLERAI